MCSLMAEEGKNCRNWSEKVKTMVIYCDDNINMTDKASSPPGFRNYIM